MPNPTVGAGYLRQVRLKERPNLALAGLFVPSSLHSGMTPNTNLGAGYLRQPHPETPNHSP